MNKSEKIICLLLGALLAWYIYGEMGKAKERAKAPATQTQTVPEKVQQAYDSKPAEPEKVVKLANAELELEFSSWGAVVKKATLKGYGQNPGEVSLVASDSAQNSKRTTASEGERVASEGERVASNPPVVLDFSASPLGELGGVPGLAPNAAYEVRDVTSNAIVFVNAFVTRKFTLGENFQLTLEETFHKNVNAGTAHADAAPMTMSLGVMAMGASKNDQLSIDSWALDAGKGKPGVIHHYEGDSPLKPFWSAAIRAAARAAPPRRECRAARASRFRARSSGSRSRTASS